MRRQLGAILIAMGLVLIFSLLVQAAMRGNASYGGVLLIGPIPIIFGSSPQIALASVLMAIVLMAISFLLILPAKKYNYDDSEGDDGPNRLEKGEKGEKAERSERYVKPGRSESPTKIKGGAVIMIGPIPLVVGSDPRTALLLMLLALAMMILWALVAKGG